jgi:hypothetical protein
MTKHIEVESSQLFTELSEQEQELASGGYDLFLQKTDIATYGNNQTSIYDGNRSFSAKSQTAYMLSQITIGLNLSTLFGDRNRGRRSGLSPLNFLYRLFQYFL